MKLYYSPGACSLSPHIVLKESGLAFEAIAAPTKTHKLADGTDYYTINPLGYVPFLVLDDGRTLHEGPAIVQYIADQVPEKELAPANGSWERYKLQEWLNTISTELHKGFSPLFTPGMPEQAKEMAKTRLISRLNWVDGELAAKTYLLGDTFTVADAYLFVVASWGKHVGIDIAGLANLSAFVARIGARPGVQAAMRAEGLLK
ncbi:MAG: glutathione transferase GstA [Gammaproteobacteria bacterium]|uniref:glutathione transferase GstA n=1 Tax=Rhodoferax sp. TaxID=50421 RepID=UPI0017B054FC|nr:glutathione transferase GstA [Rhodoferax sp.]MBU3900818.1 glutathione transferase GstA [Gammaproteobacteria bacterium]MBA3060029.1 glutathione transferase GstA [Rhodoferax sp.]MBU3996580.1 glutathione transferase GstA [Gammaproteobacteria bacterium]MBU4079569.1 glutathione transferase GstA [Gammaproteobacteria bacterium]MBU4112253.1 glutathione transferase GstA [Gammaproteobacteria bacterium]